MDIVIIGGGASGLMCAIESAKRGRKVCIIEKNSCCGKKLLITGNGKCNYWNVDGDIKHYHSNDLELINDIISRKNRVDCLGLLNDIGIVPRTVYGYYYPVSNQATSILECLLFECKKYGVKFIFDTSVEDIKKEEDKFIISTDKGIFKSSKVVMSCGGMACPKTGSNGRGYEIAKKLGHKINPVLPSLVQLRGCAKYLKAWHGVRCDVSVSIYENNKFIDKEVGEIQLTDYGVSGICIFNLSGYASKSLFFHNTVDIEINFLNQIKIQKYDEFVNYMNKNSRNKRDISLVLDCILNYNLVNIMLKLSKIKTCEKWYEIDENRRNILFNYLVKHRLEIVGTNDFDRAQTSCGGVSLKEINMNTLESKIVKNLYFTGEMIDIDGDCGGYNLSQAFITGMIVGRNI